MPLMKKEAQILQDSPSALKAFILASRPKTFIASLSPVFIGAFFAPKIDSILFVLTALFSLLIQIGTNFANDYFDFIKGADSTFRNGPKRATQEGWISPNAMKRATMAVFAMSFFVAMPLMLKVGSWSFFIALLCIACGLLYTGGPKPLGYLGLGELFVFVFFGPVATCGTFFLQTGTLDFSVFIASIAPGLFSCALLIANNLRDEKSDRLAKKKTLVARFGTKFGKWEYILCMTIALKIPFILVIFFHYPLSLLLSSLVVYPIAIKALEKVITFKDPITLISALETTALSFITYTLLFIITL